MKKTKCTPFYTENNSTNLPFYLLQDRKGNDIVYINRNNMIYLNEKNSELSFQLSMYNTCLAKGICFVYKINNDIKILKQQQNDLINWFLLDQEKQIELYQNYFDNLEDIDLYFNDNYLCLASRLYDDCLPTVVAGYDIQKDKLLDCDDYKTSNQLYKALIESRRCKFDCIYSILRGKILLEDRSRLYQFLSFILNREVNDINYNQALRKARPYILKKFPAFVDIKMKENIETIKQKNNEFGINYFCFNRMDTEIKDLKYIENKIYIKK